MNAQETLADLSEKFRATANVNAVYGEPRTVGAKTIIPVAVVSYALGAGSGRGKTEAGGQRPPGEGEGGGGGGQVTVRPVAVLEVTDERTRLIPVVDVNRIVFASLVGFGLFWLILRRIFK